MNTNKNITIRAAKPSDNVPSSSLVFTVLRSYGIEPDIDGFEADIARIGLADNPLLRNFIAEQNERVVGVATLSLAENKIGLLSGIYVDSSARRCGIGRKLLETAVESARHAGCQRIVLETRSRFKEAILLYESTGWKRGKDYPDGYGPEMQYYLDLEPILSK